MVYEEPVHQPGVKLHSVFFFQDNFVIVTNPIVVNIFTSFKSMSPNSLWLVFIVN